MNTGAFIYQLDTILGDNGNYTNYSQSTLIIFMCLATSSYNRFRRLERKFGSGALYSAAASGISTISIVGGPINIGDFIQITNIYNTETHTVTAIEQGTIVDNYMGYPISITLDETLFHNYSAGSYVGAVNPGLQIVGGQNTYFLPTDFIDFEQRSFDLANGSRYWIKRYESFYDGAYTMSDLLSGVGWGQAQTFLSFGNAGTGGVGGFAGVPNATGALNIPTNSLAGQQAFDIIYGRPNQLIINPVPGNNQFWQFNYFASYQPETVPNSDMDALLDCATAMALYSQANNLSVTGLNLTDDDQRIDQAATIKTLMDSGNSAMEKWFQKIVRRPIMLSG